MSMKRTPEWLDAHERRMAEYRAKQPKAEVVAICAAEKARLAREWNGQVDTHELSNVEFVTVTSGGARAVRDVERAGNVASGPLDSRLDRAAANAPADVLPRPVKPGPLTHTDAVGGSSCKAAVATVQCREGGAVHQPAPVCSQARTVGTSSAAPIRLPYPPSGNTAVRHANGAHYLRAEVTTYRQAVAVILQRSVPIQGRYELHVELSPPDARRRDIDNALKSLLDSMVKAGYLPDDSMAYMRKLTVVANDERRGDVVVRAVDAKEAA